MLDRPGDWQIVWEPERVIPGHFKTVQAWRMLYHFKSHIELWWNELTGKYEYRAPDPKAGGSFKKLQGRVKKGKGRGR